MDTVQKSFPLLRYREPMMLLRNTGKGFVDVSSVSGPVFQQAWVGRGMAIGDIDNDGRIDAVVTTNGGPAYVLHNETATSNHWLTLKLVGHKSNRDGIARLAMGDGNHRMRLSLVMRSTCALRSWICGRRPEHRDSLAQWNRADVERRSCGSLHHSG
jgi:hypothetical protein